MICARAPSELIRRLETFMCVSTYAHIIVDLERHFYSKAALATRNKCLSPLIINDFKLVYVYVLLALIFYLRCHFLLSVPLRLLHSLTFTSRCHVNFLRVRSTEVFLLNVLSVHICLCLVELCRFKCGCFGVHILLLSCLVSSGCVHVFILIFD